MEAARLEAVNIVLQGRDVEFDNDIVPHPDDFDPANFDGTRSPPRRSPARQLSPPRNRDEDVEVIDTVPAASGATGPRIVHARSLSRSQPQYQRALRDVLAARQARVEQAAIDALEASAELDDIQNELSDPEPDAQQLIPDDEDQITRRSSSSSESKYKANVLSVS